MVSGDEREVAAVVEGDGALGGDISEEAYRRLTLHLANWLGSWSEAGAPVVTTSPYRERPGWDGQRRSFVGIVTPCATVVSVAQRYLEPVRDAVSAGGLEELERRLGAIVGQHGAAIRRGVYRYQQRLVPHRSRGVWMDPKSPVVPEWLRPFNGEVLVALDAEGHYAAGVGRKRHDRYAQELAVVTEAAHRQQGYARDLVAQAAERVFLEGSVATYLHRPDNLASAAVAEATGFFDRGWRVLMLSFTAP